MTKRAATDKGYTFALFNGEGKQRPEIFVFPSVTQVIKATLAAPQLVAWAYRQTVDSISGLLSVVSDVPSTPWLGLHEDGSPSFSGPAEAILDIAGDADLLDEWLLLNKLRPVDLRDERAVEGKDAHEFLEYLVQSRILKTPAPVPDDGYTEAIAAWWRETDPSSQGSSIASESVVWSLSKQYAGTVDLVWTDEDGDLHVTDLKTRRAGNDAYNSDHIQVSAYAYAWEEMGRGTIAQGSVLIVHDDGTWREEDTDIGPEAFFHLRDVFRILEGM